ncbi:MAG: nicotinate phosphoribosyltransferase [Myxococcota bacterium]
MTTASGSQSLALLTDLYQLTMGAGYWKAGLAERRACFHLFFRRNPFGGGYAVAAGLDTALAYLESLRFQADDLAYLASLQTPDGSPLFEEGFVDFLAASSPQLDIHAVPEGTVVFPHEPLLRIEGPLWQAQLVETALLTIINFQTLIATKAARVCQSARSKDGTPENVLEFGLRRAQGIDGALSASRAAYIGGCAATSNVLAGRLFDIPVRGTHAHSWVMTFPSEREAFERYADAFPKGCVFLVDTYDTLEGVRTAIEVGRALRKQGHEMLGIRLDSGDLAQLSIDARRILDDAGFENAAIVASNDLDEYRIATLKEKGATITVWGVGTRLSTAYDQPALGGVYKLAAIQNQDGSWAPRIKLSETPIKTSIPTRQQVRRVTKDDRFVMDVIHSVDESPLGPFVDPEDPARARDVTPQGEALLQCVMQAGERTGASPSLQETRARTLSELARLPSPVRALREPERYFVGLSAPLAKLRNQLIEEKQ